MRPNFDAHRAAVERLLLDSLENIQVLLISTFFAFVALGIVCLLQRKIVILRAYRFKDFVTFAYMALIGVFAYRFLFQASLAFLPAQEAFIINYTWPAMVVLCAVVVLRERATPGKLIAMAFSFLGVVIIATKGHLVSFELSVKGIGLALAAAVAYGLFSALTKRQNYDRLASTTLYYGFSLLYALVVTVATSHFPSLSLSQLGGLAWLGIFPSGLAFLCWGLALKHGDTASMSNMIFITPFLSSIYVYVLIGEPILASSLVGLAVILLGIVVQSRVRTRRDQDERV